MLVLEKYKWLDPNRYFHFIVLFQAEMGLGKDIGGKERGDE